VTIVVAQACAFFVMARRSEAQKFLADEQSVSVIAVNFVPQSTQEQQRGQVALVNNQRALADEKLAASDRWRIAGIWAFGMSLLFFLIGCGLGAYAVVSNSPL
jgi:hypothetical protein